MVPDWLRRLATIIVACVSGAATANNIAKHDWPWVGFYAVLTVVGLMSFWVYLTYEPLED